MNDSKLNCHFSLKETRPYQMIRRILKMMYSMDPDVRLLAGLALATFAYNNVNQQKEIADQGGVRFNCFCPFLQSEDEYYRCLAAFQVKMLFQYLTNATESRRDNVHSQTRVTAIKIHQLTSLNLPIYSKTGLQQSTINEQF